MVKSVHSLGLPPVDAKLFAYEVCSFLIAHYERFERISDRKPGEGHHWLEDGDGSESDGDDVVPEAMVRDPSKVELINDMSLRMFVSSLIELLTVMNGRWWLPEPEHWCSGSSCCSPRAATAQKVAQAWRKSLQTYSVHPSNKQVDEACAHGGHVDFRDVASRDLQPSVHAARRAPGPLVGPVARP